MTVSKGKFPKLSTSQKQSRDFGHQQHRAGEKNKQTKKKTHITYSQKAQYAGP
jgi:hypothetical protein